MAKEKITEENLITRVRGEITSSLGYMGDTISQQREMAMQYYYSLPFGNEVDGRSQFVDLQYSRIYPSRHLVGQEPTHF